MSSKPPAPLRWVGRLLLWVVGAIVAYQVWLFGWVCWYSSNNPGSTSFMQAEADRIEQARGKAQLRQRWVPYDRISKHLKRAVIAAEDDEFTSHEGVNWDAIERAYEHNQKLEEARERAEAKGRRVRTRPIRGGSTITQQLAKNLFLSAERSYLRKGQELVITYMIEAVMDKRRILELYLNVVEWGNGVFGAEAAARYYFGVTAAELGPEQSARLAAMLPRPKFFDKNRGSGFLARHAGSIARRMHRVDVP